MVGLKKPQKRTERMNKIRFSINDTVEPEVLEIIQKVLPITDKIVIAFLVLNVRFDVVILCGFKYLRCLVKNIKTES
jgi:hypothetical protein